MGVRIIRAREYAGKDVSNLPRATGIHTQELSQLFRPIRNPIKSRSTTSSAPFKQIAMVLTSLFSNETDQRFKRILTAIDLFTKKGWAVPMTNKDTASIHAALQLQGEFWIVGVKFVLAA